MASAALRGNGPLPMFWNSDSGGVSPVMVSSLVRASPVCRSDEEAAHRASKSGRWPAASKPVVHCSCFASAARCQWKFAGVGDIRKAICGLTADAPRAVTRNGTTYTQKTANIGGAVRTLASDIGDDYCDAASIAAMSSIGCIERPTRWASSTPTAKKSPICPFGSLGSIRSMM